MKKIALILCLIINVVNFSLFAASSSTGTTSAEFLQTMPDARVSSMSGSTIAVIDNQDNHFFNPASVAMAKRKEVQFSTMKLNGFSDGFGGARLVTAGFLWGSKEKGKSFGPFHNKGNLAFDLMYSSYGDIPITTISPDSTGSFAPMNLMAGVTYGNRLNGNNIVKNIPFGVTMKYLFQGMGQFGASHGLAFDVGATYIAPRPSKLNGFKFAVSMLNLGFASALNNVSDPLPMAVKAGVSYSYFLKNVARVFGANAFRSNREDGLITLDVTQAVGNNFIVGIGKEFRFMNILALRIGFEAFEDQRGLTAGMGINYSKGGNVYTMDFGWSPQGLLGDNFRLTFKYGWGGTNSSRNGKLGRVLESPSSSAKVRNLDNFEN